MDFGKRRGEVRGWLPWAELLLIAAIVYADIRGWIPLSKTIFLLLVAWASLRLRGLRWSDAGLRRPARWPRALVIGALAGLAMEAFANLVSQPLITFFTGEEPDLSDFRPLVGNLELLMLFLVLNWVLAAFGEEMVYRGYLMPRVAGLAGGGRAGWAVSLVLVSAFFGCAHDYQGLTGILQEGVSGLLLGLLYLAAGRTLTVPIVAHGVANTAAFVLIYLGRYPGVGG